MSKEKIYIFDTTLRDGAQTQGVDFSIDEKNRIATALSKLGVDYIEAGWPGANPTDTNFFNKPPKLSSSTLVAFGMTKKSGRSAENDPGLSAILNSNTKSVCIVGKTWDFHVDVALGISKEENLENIVDTTKHFVKNNREYMFDAEHFFDGYKNNKDYALKCIRSAYDNGARWIVLCDTNGGTLPFEIEEIVNDVAKVIPGKNLGIHTHNDTENAVANTLAAIRSGARQVQGTLNGLGERCGNANIVSIIPTLLFKNYFIDRFDISNIIIEDLRVFKWNGQKYFIGTIWDKNEFYPIILDSFYNIYYIDDNKGSNFKYNKNFSPLIYNDKLFLIINHNPLEIIEVKSIEKDHKNIVKTENNNYLFINIDVSKVDSIKLKFFMLFSSNLS